MPNFSSLAGLEVAEKFLWGGVGGGWGGLHSNFHVKPNRCVVLCWGWGFDNKSWFVATLQSLIQKISLPKEYGTKRTDPNMLLIFYATSRTGNHGKKQS